MFVVCLALEYSTVQCTVHVYIYVVVDDKDEIMTVT